MMEKEITLQQVRQDCRTGLLTGIWALFAALGLGLMGRVLVDMLREPTSGSITGFILVTLFFGIPFGVLGLLALIRTVKEGLQLRRGEVRVYVDQIKEKRKLNNGMEPGQRRQYQLRLENYTAVTGRKVTARNNAQFDRVKKGDPCILIFVGKGKKPYWVYPGSGYVLGQQLQEKAVGDIRQILG